MRVGEKYIIEISDVVDGNLAKIKGFNTLIFDENGLNKLEKIGDVVQIFTPQEINDIKKISNNLGYSEGYDEGFNDGVAHQVSMASQKTEPHKPQEGDVYLDSFGQAFVIFDVEETKCNKMYDDGSGREVEIEKLKTLKRVGNVKANLEALQKAVGSYEFKEK